MLVYGDRDEAYCDCKIAKVTPRWRLRLLCTGMGIKGHLSLCFGHFDSFLGPRNPKRV